MARTKKEQKEETKDSQPTLQEALAIIDASREVATTQLEEGEIKLKSLSVSKEGKQFMLSFISTTGNYYSRKLNTGKKNDQDSFWVLFSYFRSQNNSLKLPDSNWVLFMHDNGGSPIYRCFHKADSNCEKLQALGFKHAPFSIKNFMTITTKSQDLLELFSCFGQEISYSPVEVVFGAKNRRMVIPVDSTKEGLELDMLQD